MDVNQYLEIFLDEAKEHLQSLSNQLLILEQEPDNENTINEIFRAAHSIKGMAGTMGYKKMQALTHEMENVFSEVRNQKLVVTDHMVDVLFQSLDALEEYTENVHNTSDEGDSDNEHLVKELQELLEQGLSGAEAAVEKPVVNETPEEYREDDSMHKWHEIVFSEEEKQTVVETLVAEKSIYGITVYVQESCILKAARAFLVFKALEEIGTIITSNPSIQDIEDERFGLEFSIAFASDSSMEEVKATAETVSEIESVYIGLMEFDNMESQFDEDTDDEGSDAQMINVDDTAVTSAAAGMHTAKAAPQKQENNKKPASTNKPVVNRTVRVDIEKLDVLMNLVSELIIAKNSLVAASNAEDRGHSNAGEHIEYLESVTTNLHESVMKVRMVPIESVLVKFPKMIRDLSKKLNKKMELHMTGEDTELDRTVVDEIGDPLMHLLRNSADHGLESTEERIRNGKSEVGTVNLDAYQDGNNVVIEVSDDGKGIDVENVKAKAIERGTVTAEQAEIMSDKDIMELLFLPSFSTAKQVSDVSGRGVGLDVVKSKVESLGGEVEVKSKMGVGSTFIIRLPLTLAIIQALMVEVSGEKYAISLGTIQTIEDIPENEIKFVQNKEVITLRGDVLPLVRLHEILDIEPPEREEGEKLLVVVVKKGDKLAGLVVDELMGQQEIVIKSLGKYTNKCKIISGATILGDGEIALILDTNSLI